MKILILDIETFPNLAYVWGMYEQNVIKFKQQTCIASYVYKWLDEKKVYGVSLPDFSGYKPGSYDDKKLVQSLWPLLDAADVVVAHNGQSFDVKVIQGRFLAHDIKPPSPFQQVDTKLAVKKVSRFNSNKLDDLGELFGLGKKIKTDFGLWLGCINGDKKAWANMMKYNKQDVLLLEKLYLRLLPWISSHPNRSLFENRPVCPKCGSKKLQKAGTRRCVTRSYTRYRCSDCGGWSQATKSLPGGAEIKNAY